MVSVALIPASRAVGDRVTIATAAPPLHTVERDLRSQSRVPGTTAAYHMLRILLG